MGKKNNNNVIVIDDDKVEASKSYCDKAHDILKDQSIRQYIRGITNNSQSKKYSKLNNLSKRIDDLIDESIKLKNAIKGIELSDIKIDKLFNNKKSKFHTKTKKIKTNTGTKPQTSINMQTNIISQSTGVSNLSTNSDVPAQPRPAPAPPPAVKYVTRYDLSKSAQEKLNQFDKIKEDLNKKIHEELENYVKTIPSGVRPPNSVISTEDLNKWEKADECQEKINEYLQQISKIEMLESELIDYERVRPYEEYYDAEDFDLLSKEGIKPLDSAPFEEKDYYTYFETDLKDNDKYLTPEQKELITYLYNKFGYEKSHNYVVALQEQINKSKGFEAALEEIRKMANDQEAFEKFMQNSSDSLEAQISLGIRGFGSGVEQGVAKYFDDIASIFDPTGSTTTLDYKQMWILQMVSTDLDLGDLVTEEDKKLIEKCKSLSTEWGYKIGTGVGYMVPSILASTVVSAPLASGAAGMETAAMAEKTIEMAHKAGEIAGLATMFVGEFGAQNRKALQNDQPGLHYMQE